MIKEVKEKQVGVQETEETHNLQGEVLQNTLQQKYPGPGLLPIKSESNQTFGFLVFKCVFALCALLWITYVLIVHCLADATSFPVSYQTFHADTPMSVDEEVIKTRGENVMFFWNRLAKMPRSNPLNFHIFQSFDFLTEKKKCC